jgi:LUD domain
VAAALSGPLGWTPASATRPGPEFLGVAHYPDVPDPATCNVEREHRHDDAILLGHQTLRLSGIDADMNTSGRYQAIKPQTLAMDRITAADDIRRLRAVPDVVVGSVHAVTETGSLVAASGTGSQLPAYAGGAARAIWIVGAQKLVPDLPAALRRVEDYCLPLESARTQTAYGSPSAINRLLILNAELHPGRGTVLLLREAIGF